MTTIEGTYVFRNAADPLKALAVNDDNRNVEVHSYREDKISERALWRFSPNSDAAQNTVPSYVLYNVFHQNNSDGWLKVDGDTLQIGKGDISQRWIVSGETSGYVIEKAEGSGSSQGGKEKTHIIEDLHEDKLKVVNREPGGHSIWDIRYIAESFFAIVSMADGKFLCVDDKGAVKAEEFGVPRQFIWDIIRGVKKVGNQYEMQDYFVARPLFYPKASPCEALSLRENANVTIGPVSRSWALASPPEQWKIESNMDGTVSIKSNEKKSWFLTTSPTRHNGKNNVIVENDSKNLHARWIATRIGPMKSLAICSDGTPSSEELCRQLRQRELEMVALSKEVAELKQTVRFFHGIVEEVLEIQRS